MFVGRHERPEQIEVEDEARRLFERASEAVGVDRDAEVDWPPRGLDSLERATSAAIETAVDEIHESSTAPRRLAALAELVVELEAMRGRLRERRVVLRLESFVSVQETLARLRVITDLGTLLAEAPKAICEACGLERGVLSRVTGSEWTIEGAHFDGDPEWSAEFVELGRGEHRAQLNHLMLETEMVRRRTPAIVHNALSNPLAHRPLVEHADVRSYVGAPIMPAGQVIGFVHGDHYFSGHPVDSLDRDALWAFAQGFGHVYERAVLLERLRTQRNEVRNLLASADSVVSALTEAEIRFSAADDRAPADVARSAAAMFQPESRIEALVTRRELEVLGLMAGGATNVEIAQQLVIAEGTVKSHVKHILRKLRAANRAEAVSKYLHLSFREGAERPAETGHED